MSLEAWIAVWVTAWLFTFVPGFVWYFRHERDMTELDFVGMTFGLIGNVLTWPLVAWVIIHRELKGFK